MLKGLFRDREDWVRVRYSNGREIDMPKARYVGLRLKPPFEDLPEEHVPASPNVALCGPA